MKRYILVVFSAIFLFNLAQAKDFSASITFDKDNIKQMYQEDLKNLSEYISQEVAAQTSLYANDRVKNMCKEWPTCEEWAKNKLVKDTTFQIIDTEVERWISKWEKHDAIWTYRFYVQTKEKGQIKAYLFRRGEKGISYSAPVLIKKFPGHPMLSEPTEHIVNTKINYRSGWPGIIEWGRGLDIIDAAIAQYVYKWDKEGNPLWKRRLYVKLDGFFHHRVFYFQAYQTKTEGDYTYQAPVEIGSVAFRFSLYDHYSRL